MAPLDTDTISAIATPLGRGGIGIVRVSGPDTCRISQQICGRLPNARTATTARFSDSNSSVLDEGIALYFPRPDSFTGEDVLELQGHGGPQVLNAILRLTLDHGARLARPGEFTERAFHNCKLDLLQAEAIADLIDASSEQAMRSAMRTLQGVFSAHVNRLVEEITAIRVNVEAAIDFSDEEIDVMGQSDVAASLTRASKSLQTLLRQAGQGALLQEGIAVVIAGAPNAGKSSLHNALAGNDSAIVTDIPGTTRDLLKEQLNLDGLPVHITDTAGLRHSDNIVEQEGIRRAREAISKADCILMLVDGAQNSLQQPEFLNDCLQLLVQDQADLSAINQIAKRLCLVINKIDLVSSLSPGITSTRFQQENITTFHISAKNGLGIDEISSFLKSSCGYEFLDETAFMARERHLRALNSAEELLNRALLGVSEHLPLELLAEDLRLAQQALNSITGQVSSDDLLGEIFSSFCIGK